MNKQKNPTANTRMTSGLIGLVVLIVFYGIGVRYKLYLLKWILDHFFDSFFIVTQQQLILNY